MPTKKCLNCENEYYAKPSQFEQRKCCSIKCSSTISTKNRLKKCVYCGKMFDPRGYTAQTYCNRECIKKHNISKKRDCIICGKKISNKNKKYCSNKCYSTTLVGKESSTTFWKYATKEEKLNRLLENFNKHAIKNETGCWGWKGGNAKKYPSLYYDLKGISAHRASYMLFKGEIPDGMLILHSCDNTKCCRPSHLRYGSQLDNVKDMYDRGRKNDKVSEEASGAKLKEVQVIEIKKILSQGVVMQKIADKFNVGLVTIFDIKHKKTWKHIK